MIKVNFDYNFKKDAWSWVLIAKDKNMWGLNWRDQIALDSLVIPLLTTLIP